MKNINVWEQIMRYKWEEKYKNNLDYIIKLVNYQHFSTVEFEIYYTTNHNHDIDYILDLLSFKNYV
jgi:hypothetical protein